MNTLSLDIASLWLLRVIIVLSGAYQLMWGTPLVGLILLGSVFALLFPRLYTKNAITAFPVEVELVLLFIAVITGVLGEGQDFYGRVPYYDKFVHALIPFFMGLFGLLILYALRAAGRIRLPYYVIFPVVVMTMFGVQSVWEILEYVSDKTQFSTALAWEQAQGNALEDPHQDTMNDLVVDMIGTLVGTSLAYFLVKNGVSRAHSRIRTFIELLKTKFRLSPRWNSRNATRFQLPNSSPRLVS